MRQRDKKPLSENLPKPRAEHAIENISGADFLANDEKIVAGSHVSRVFYVSACYLTGSNSFVHSMPFYAIRISRRSLFVIE